MKLKKIIILLGMLLLLNVSTASAFYKLSSSGNSRVNSEGFLVPFPHALQMIHPEGWSIVVEGDMGISADNVSWGNEATWEEAVLATAKQANSSVKIDYTGKKIFVRRNPPARYVLRSTPQGYAQPVSMGEIAGEYVLEEIHPAAIARGQVSQAASPALVNKDEIAAEYAKKLAAETQKIENAAAMQIKVANEAAAAAADRAAAAEEKAAMAMKAAEEAKAVSKAMVNTAESNVGAKTVAETRAIEAAKAAEQARQDVQRITEESKALIAAAREQADLHARAAAQAREEIKTAEAARNAAEVKAAEALEKARLVEERLAQAIEAQISTEARIQEVENAKTIALQEAVQEAVKEVTTVSIEGKTVELPIWNLTKGSLKAQLTGWAENAGYQFVWRPAFDVTLGANVEVHGNLHDALAKVLDGLRGEGTLLSADIYESNKLIIVKGQ